MPLSLLPPKAVELLGTATYDPNAVRRAELMTASFIWSDERGGVPGNLPSVRTLFGYRGTLHRGNPDESMRRPWDQLRAALPEWPGFRPERCNAGLRDELEREFDSLAMDFLQAAGGEEAGTKRPVAPDRSPGSDP